MAGPQHILNGGIIAVLVDCHCVCTAMASGYHAEGREVTSEPSLWYATASLQVTYLRPTPIAEPVVLRAHITIVR
jgi:acyl-coenzyme A thioesterase PaaI-like protein